MGKNSQMAVQKEEYLQLKEKMRMKLQLNELDVETLAKDYHEICREMVNKQIGMIIKPSQSYIEWKDLTEEQKEGRKFVARGFLKLYTMIKND